MKATPRPFKPRPSRRGMKLRFAPRPNRRKDRPLEELPPASIIAPPVSFAVPNFKDGRSIRYTFSKAGYRYQVGDDAAVQTVAMTYPEVAALARHKYGVPAIGCASTGKGIAA